MRRWLTRLPTVSYAIITLLSGQCSNAIAAEGSDLYRCKAHSVMRLGPEGTLVQHWKDSDFRSENNSFFIDTSSGTLREGTYVKNWKILQRQSEVNDFVAADGPQQAAAVTDFIRVRAWKSEEKVKFFRVGLTVITTGTCDPVR